jgi:hypothetical protein
MMSAEAMLPHIAKQCGALNNPKLNASSKSLIVSLRGFRELSVVIIVKKDAVGLFFKVIELVVAGRPNKPPQRKCDENYGNWNEHEEQFHGLVSYPA